MCGARCRSSSLFPLLLSVMLTSLVLAGWAATAAAFAAAANRAVATADR